MTEINPTLILLAVVFLIVLAVVIFVAVLAYLQRGQSKKRSEQMHKGVEPRQQPSPPASGLEALSSTSAPAHPGEVMRVIRDQQTGQVLVEVNGQQYAHIREIKDAQVGRRVLWAIADLLRFTGGMAANPQAVRSVSQGTFTPPSPSPRPRQQTEAETMPEQQPTSLAEPSTLPATALDTPRAGDRAASPLTDQPAVQADIGRTITDFFRRGIQPPPVVRPAGSFVDEIEEVLQSRIRNRPVPLPYEVHVKTGKDGLLQIEVGADTYASPDDIPDPEIRSLIKSAVAEWERR
jgi:hypothetical protein